MNADDAELKILREFYKNVKCILFHWNVHNNLFEDTNNKYSAIHCCFECTQDELDEINRIPM